MFVIDKNDETTYRVYDITYDNTGYPHFLIYKGKQWIRVSAKYFVPHCM